MKRIMCLLTVVGLVACALPSLGQTTPPAGEAASTTAGETTANNAVQPETAAPAEPAVQAATLAQATPAEAPAAPAIVAQAQPAAEAAKPPAAEAPAPPAEPKASSAPQSGAIIPLIVMDDVPLNDAIRNLARQAGLNYMLDPRIGFGQAGPDGKVVPQPMVSIRWENITAEQALNSLLGNYGLQLVEDPKSKIARVTVKDPAAPDPLVTRIIQLKYCSPSNIIVAVQNTFTDKRSKVVPDNRTSQLVVLATEKELVDVDQLVLRLDTQTKQVLIEARLMETTVNPATVKGVDWTGTLQKQHVRIGNNAVADGLVTPPWQILGNMSAGSFFNPAMAFLNAEGVSAVLSFLNTYAETKVISTPRTVTLDNELSTIEVGLLFPIVNVTAGTANTTGGSQVTYSNLTVRLDVTPRISANDYINLKVTPRVTRLGDTVKSTVANTVSEVYSFRTRAIDTSVMIPSGNTLVMGGLIEDAIRNGNVKVPLLGDIPYLGGLFRYDSKERGKQNLIFFITPTIIRDTDYQPTKTDFLKIPVPPAGNLEADWSAWDSGQPASEIKADNMSDKSTWDKAAK